MQQNGGTCTDADSSPHLGLVCRGGAAALVALRVGVGGGGVGAQVGLGRQVAAVLLFGPRGDLHGRQLSRIQLLWGGTDGTGREGSEKERKGGSKKEEGVNVGEGTEKKRTT